MSGFSDSVVGGVGTLVRAFIRSKNYVAGVSGWNISKDGAAEFNNGTFRGQVKVIASNGSVILISPGSSSPVIQFLSPDGTNDAFINAVNSGVANRADLGMNSGKFTPADGVVRRARVYLADSADTGVMQVIRESDQSAFGGRFAVTSNQAIFGYENDTVTPNVSKFIYITATGIGSSDPISMTTNGGFVAVAPLNGWTNASGNNAPLQIKSVPSPAESIQIVGTLLAGATKADGTTLFTLPGWAKPNKSVRFDVVASTTPVGRSPAIIIDPVTGNGNVYGVNAAGAVDIGFCYVYPLNMI